MSTEATSSGGGGARAAATTASAAVQTIPVHLDSETFEGRQAMRMRELERRMQEDIQRRGKDWEQKLEKMREEFLTLHPCDGGRTAAAAGGGFRNGDVPPSADDRNHATTMTTSTKLCGSTEVLNVRKMKTLFFEYPDTGGSRKPRGDSRRRYQLRFNLADFEPASVRVTTDGSRIVVRAARQEEDEHGITTTREYARKIQKPREVDHVDLRSFLTVDGVLIVEAPLLGHSASASSSAAAAKKNSFALGQMSHSVSASSHGSHASKSSRESKASSTETPSKEKIGVPIFRDENGSRRLHLTVELGAVYTPEDITVQVIKENRIQIRAKHREKTCERLNTNKFVKEYELGEKIETFSLKGGLTADGKLIVGAYAKGHGAVPS